VRRFIIGGIGNVLMGDDGVGPYVARMISAMYEFDSTVEVCDFGTPGLDLVIHLSDTDAVILIDAVDNGKAPGSVTLYPRSEILRVAPPMRLDPHSPALKETLLIAELEGKAPKDVVLIGVSGLSYNMCEGLSDTVRAAVPGVIEVVLEEAKKIGMNCRRKDLPQGLAIFWDSVVSSETESVRL
jgi:hydrogenase maturation protease